MNRRLLPLAAVATVMASMATACAFPRLPSQQPVIPPLPQTSLVFDDHGKLITSLHAGENRTLIPLSDVPKIVQDAVLAAEDAGFYAHHGVDLKAVARAAYQDARSGHIVQGGSTITEQLVKNTITGDDRTLGRKLREAIVAYHLEDEYSKGEILQLYLNTVYFGQGAYGIESAARTYFSRHASKLTLNEGAILAALIASPSRFDPVFHPGLAKQRRNLVLKQMLELHKIDGGTYEEATTARLGLNLAKDQERYPAAYFVDYVERWFLNNRRFGQDYQAAYEKLFKGGLRIYTTVDLTLQREAERAVNSILAYRTDPYAAMTVIDPRNGAIRAMVGGRDWFSKTDDVAKLNLAIRLRQPGSAFKPFTLVTALEQGIQPNRVYAAPSYIEIALPRGYPTQDWAVSNYDGGGGGSMTIEQATIDSVNTVYAQLVMDVGPDNVVRTAKQMGITTSLHPYPSSVLGTSEVNTVEMASAYGTLGQRVPPMAVTRITDAAGHLIYRAEPKPKQVLQPSVAWATDQILQKVVQGGTGIAATIGRPVAGKTGTAQGWTNAWFVGFVPQLVGAVWVGFPHGQIPMVSPRTRLPHVLGGTWPAQVWHAFMVNATRRLPVEGFPQPATEYVQVPIDVTQRCVANQYTLPKDIQVVQYLAGTEPTDQCAWPPGPQQVSVPSVVGLTQQEARQTLESYGFPVSVTTQETPGTDPGTVLAESPSGGSTALQGTTVSITVSVSPYASETSPEPRQSTDSPASPSPPA
jgi:penicillin-binding protein 1A